jgi:succinate dehydrogenase/fumarate reductase cytochrome b subunit
MILYTLFASMGFGVLYVQTAFSHTQSPAAALANGSLVLVAFAIAFLVPPRFFRYTNADVAPAVLSRLMARGAAAAAITLVTNVAVWLSIGRESVPLIEELYVYSLVAILLFHGLGGVIAAHVVYLQATKQYNSNQLAAVLLLITLLLLVLVLYFIAFDWAIPRDAYIHLRDLTMITLVLLGYGRAIYLMAHH